MLLYSQLITYANATALIEFHSIVYALCDGMFSVLQRNVCCVIHYIFHYCLACCGRPKVPCTDSGPYVDESGHIKSLHSADVAQSDRFVGFLCTSSAGSRYVSFTVFTSDLPHMRSISGGIGAAQLLYRFTDAHAVANIRPHTPRRSSAIANHPADRLTSDTPAQHMDPS